MSLTITHETYTEICKILTATYPGWKFASHISPMDMNYTFYAKFSVLGKSLKFNIPFNQSISKTIEIISHEMKLRCSLKFIPNNTTTISYLIGEDRKTRHHYRIKLKHIQKNILTEHDMGKFPCVVCVGIPTTIETDKDGNYTTLLDIKNQYTARVGLNLTQVDIVKYLGNGTKPKYHVCNNINPSLNALPEVQPYDKTI